MSDVHQKEGSANESNSLDVSAISVDDICAKLNTIPSQVPSSRSMANPAAKIRICQTRRNFRKLKKADNEKNMSDTATEASEKDSKNSEKSMASKSTRTIWLRKMSWNARKALALHVQLNADDMIFMGGFEMWCNEILAERAFVIKRVWNWKIDHSKYFLNLTKDEAWKLFSEEIGDLLRHSIQILRWFEEFDKLDNARKRLLIIKHAPVLCGLIASMQYNSNPCRYVVYKAERMLGPWIRPLLEQYGEISKLVCQVLRNGLERLSELDLHFVDLALYGCYIVFLEMESTTAGRLKRLLAKRLTKQENKEQKILDQIHARCQPFREFKQLHKKALGVYLARKPKKVVLDKAYLDVLWTNGDVKDGDIELKEEKDDCQDNETGEGKSSLFKEDKKTKQEKEMQEFTEISDSTTEIKSTGKLRTSRQSSAEANNKSSTTNETVEKASIIHEVNKLIPTETDNGLTLENSEDAKKSGNVSATNVRPEILISTGNEPEMETSTNSNILNRPKSMLEDLIERKQNEATISCTNETILTVSKRPENKTGKRNLGCRKYITEALSCKKPEDEIPVTEASKLRFFIGNASEMKSSIRRRSLSSKKPELRTSTCDNPEIGSSNIHTTDLLGGSLAEKTKAKNSKRGRPKKSGYKTATRVNDHSEARTSIENRGHNKNSNYKKSDNCSNRKRTKDKDDANVETRGEDSAVTISTADSTGFEGLLNNQSEVATSRSDEERSSEGKLKETVLISESDILISKLGKTKAYEFPSCNRIEADDSLEHNNFEGGISTDGIPGNEVSNGKRLELRGSTHNEPEMRAIMVSEVDVNSSDACTVANDISHAISETPETVTFHGGTQNGMMIGLGAEDKTLAGKEVSTEISAKETTWEVITPETSTLIQSETNITTGEVFRDGTLSSTTSETEGRKVEGKTATAFGMETVAQEAESSAVLLHGRTTEGKSEIPNLLENSSMGLSAFQTVLNESKSSQRRFQSQEMVSFTQIQPVPTVAPLQPPTQLASSILTEMPFVPTLTSESRVVSLSAPILPYEGFTLMPSPSDLSQLNFMPPYGLQQWHSPSQMMQIPEMSAIQPLIRSSSQETLPMITPDEITTDNTEFLK